MSIDLGNSILLCRSLAHFNHEFCFSLRICLSIDFLSHKHFGKSLFRITNREKEILMGHKLRLMVAACFYYVRRLLKLCIFMINESLCLSQNMSRIFVSLAFVPRCCFTKFKSLL